MTRTFKITMDVSGVSDEDLIEYITDAVLSWGGGFHPQDPLFGLDEDQVKVEKMESDE